MSTKSSIARGEGFHLYSEAFEDGCVYLDLHDSDSYTVTETTVRIPLHVFAAIQKTKPVDVSKADFTDEEIKELAEERVNDRIAYVHKIEKVNPKNVALAKLMGAASYGSADDPYDEQISRAIDLWTKVREEHRQIRDFVESCYTTGPEIHCIKIKQDNEKEEIDEKQQ